MNKATKEKEVQEGGCLEQDTWIRHADLQGAG